MVIEWLRFQVKPELREKFIQLDQEIWSAALFKYGGYLGKQVWLDPQDQDVVILIGWWESREKWKAIAQEELDQIEAQFLAAMGEGTYQLIEGDEYQVRKFTIPPKT